MSLLLLFILATTSCSDFDELNVDPSAVGEGQLQPEYFLNRGIIQAQQDGWLNQIVFSLVWRQVARFGGQGDYYPNSVEGHINDGWTSSWLSVDNGLGWIIALNQAVKYADKQLEEGGGKPYTNNIKQIARIWRAALIAQFVTEFGPFAVPIELGEVAEYKSEEDLLYYVLEELKDAPAKLDENAMANAATYDAVYEGDLIKWRKFANSLRLRYAMVLSEVEPAKAKSEFEDALGSSLDNVIINREDIAGVKEVSYGALEGVMYSSWTVLSMSNTYNNLVVGLGSQTPAYLLNTLPAEGQAYLKDPNNYLGLYLPDHLPLNTNDPCAGYFFDGIPSKIDPRAVQTFNIPGYVDPNAYSYIQVPKENVANEALLMDPTNATNVKVKIRTQYSWSTWVAGDWGDKAGISGDLIDRYENYPRVSYQYRHCTETRIWFGNWETRFLLAEAKHRGWNVPGTVKEHYEAGITANFTYLGLGGDLANYLTSTSYNRVGTSVSFDHTTEATTRTIAAKDGYTNDDISVSYNYPVNSIYNGGKTNNDVLTKIITQKFLAYVPYQPLEAWTDHRRLGLPFFENPSVDRDFRSDLLPLTRASAKECKWEFYTQRNLFPSSVNVINPTAYENAVQLLDGPNKVTTGLWWSGKRKAAGGKQ
jgi:hypothetical protein